PGDENETEPELATAAGTSIFGNVLALRNDMDFQATVEGALITARPLQAAEAEEEPTRATGEPRPIATTPAEIAQAAAEAEDEAAADASSLVDVLRILQPGGAEPQEESLAEMVAGLNVSIGGKSAADREVPSGPVGPQPVSKGQAATVWVWKSRLGQKLLRRLNGSADSTLLADWLAGSFPRIYGAEAGGSPLDDKHPGNNLSGLTNENLAAYFKSLYKRSKRTTVGGGPPRLEAQLLATALSAYVTTEDCVGRRFGAEEAYAEDTDVILVNEIRGYGFDVSSEGVGGATFALGENAHVLGFEDADEPTVMQIMQATDQRARYGLLFDLDEDGDARDEEETQARTAANGLFEAINEKGEF
ncbi:MAG: hypothetical protein OER86_07685, partial [Phycisphaerae bacterium]|nr:hypothetical protein [Phycisphaerae bacterium]